MFLYNDLNGNCLSLSAGDETPVNLAVVQASSRDTGVYGCVITNEYGTDATDTLLSADSMYSHGQQSFC